MRESSFNCVPGGNHYPHTQGPRLKSAAKRGGRRARPRSSAGGNGGERDGDEDQRERAKFAPRGNFWLGRNFFPLFFPPRRFPNRERSGLGVN